MVNFDVSAKSATDQNLSPVTSLNWYFFVGGSLIICDYLLLLEVSTILQLFEIVTGLEAYLVAQRS